ncbi:MAG: hypothetical protein KY476_25920, partial [Planctomycetes bacterium]|nr:hypothetical protein [Planctomycetota bacterium]
MPIQFRCTACRQKLSISTRKAGREVSCPACGERLVVPAPEPAVPVAEEQAAAPEATPDADIERRHPEVAAERQRDDLLAASIEADEAEEFSLRKADTDFEEMDLTPMVDVTFLL